MYLGFFVLFIVQFACDYYLKMESISSIKILSNRLYTKLTTEQIGSRFTERLIVSHSITAYKSIKLW